MATITNVLVGGRTGCVQDGFAPSRRREALATTLGQICDAACLKRRTSACSCSLCRASRRVQNQASRAGRVVGGGRGGRRPRFVACSCGNCTISGWRPTPIDAMVTHWLISTQVVVAGDMNAEFNVGSALAAVVSPDDGDAADARRACAVALRHAPDDSELEAWAELRREARLATQMTLRSGGLLGRVPTGATRCGYDHEVPNSTAMRAWSLDHLLYSPATLSPVARWATLEADPGRRSPRACRTRLAV